MIRHGQNQISPQQLQTSSPSRSLQFSTTLLHHRRPFTFISNSSSHFFQFLPLQFINLISKYFSDFFVFNFTIELQHLCGLVILI